MTSFLGIVCFFCLYLPWLLKLFSNLSQWHLHLDKIFLLLLQVQLLSSTSLKKRLENLRRILKILSKAGNRKPNNWKKISTHAQTQIQIMLHNFSTSFNQSDTIDGKIPTLFLKKKKLYIYQNGFSKKREKNAEMFFCFFEKSSSFKTKILKLIIFYKYEKFNVIFTCSVV